MDIVKSLDNLSYIVITLIVNYNMEKLWKEMISASFKIL
jgi:hypothetical protein